MLRSLFSAITGLQGQQTYMDVISNNIANVNTVGFQAGRITFENVLSQTLRGGTAPTVATGGQDPAQVGMGVGIGTIDQLQTQGTLESTGKTTDLAIQGDGFFVVNNGQENHYTRAGAFSVGSD